MTNPLLKVCAAGILAVVFTAPSLSAPTNKHQDTIAVEDGLVYELLKNEADRGNQNAYRNLSSLEHIYGPKLKDLEGRSKTEWRSKLISRFVTIKYGAKPNNYSDLDITKWMDKWGINVEQTQSVDRGSASLAGGSAR